MESTSPTEIVPRQAAVNALFGATSQYWKRVYEEQTLAGVIYQQRRALALQWIDTLSLPPGAEVLELGCGAGLTVVDLAQRGYRVECLDASDAMVRLALAQTQGAGVEDRVVVRMGDAHALPYPDGSQQLVLALGVLPWLHSPGAALAEVARVLQPGGHVLFSTDNRLRLNHLLDPRLIPPLAPLRRLLRWVARSLGRARPEPLGAFVTYREIRRLVVDAGLTPLRRTTFGFGPFSLLGRYLLPEAAAIRLHRRLQVLADRGVPLLRATGSQDLILARKPLPT